MTEYNHLNHTTWDCKYHVVFIPKYRKKLLFGQLRARLGAVMLVRATDAETAKQILKACGENAKLNLP